MSNPSPSRPTGRSVLRRRLLGSLAAGAAVATLLPFVGCGSKSYGPFEGSKAYDHTEAICAFGPRPPGSENLRKVANYIEQQLAAISPDLKLERQTFRKEELDPALQAALGKDAKVEFQNLWVRIPGTQGGDHPPILALAAHYDSKITHPGEQDFEFVGAIDAAASCGILIELASHLHQNRIGPDVWIIWFDGEESIAWEWEDEQALIGSTHFAETMANDKKLFPKGLHKRMRAFVLLDLLGDPEIKIDRDATKSNPLLLDIFKATADEMGMGDRMYRYQLGNARLDWTMKDDHLPFVEKYVPAIDLIDFRYRIPSEHNDQTPAEAKKYTAWWHTPKDTMDQVSAESLDFVGNLVLQAIPRIVSSELFK